LPGPNGRNGNNKRKMAMRQQPMLPMLTRSNQL